MGRNRDGKAVVGRLEVEAGFCADGFDFAVAVFMADMGEAALFCAGLPHDPSGFFKGKMGRVRPRPQRSDDQIIGVCDEAE